MPTIAEIPDATALHLQLETLNRAIEILQTEGATLFTLAVNKPPPEDGDVDGPGPGGYAALPDPNSAVYVSPNPAIDDPTVLDVLAEALQKQADDVTRQLTDLGYTES